MLKPIEHIFPQPEAPGMVGDGFRVYNYIPGAGIPQRRIDPFLLLDFNAEIDFPPSNHARGVGAHPHKGFETVTIAYKGSVSHHDSAGNSGTINSGDGQWMTAGAGLLHKEYHSQEFARTGGPFEMVQLWVNLPKKDKLTPPHYQALTASQMGKLFLPQGQGHVNVIAGTFNGVTGPAHTYSELVVADLHLEKAATLSTSLPAQYNTMLLLVNGNATVNGQQAPEHSVVLFANEGEEITITANSKAVILLLSGQPLNEPIAHYGPFVMNTQEELLQSIREAQSGAYGKMEYLSRLMLPWKSIIQVQKEGDSPVYLQIANAISLEIKKGHLGPGVKLPGTRQLSDLLDVHRITVVRAYEELDAQGWIEMRPSQGSFTSRALPEISPRELNGKTARHSFATTTGYSVPVNPLIKDPSLPLRHIMGFHDGPDPRQVPIPEIAKAFRSILTKKVNLKYTSYVESAGVSRFRHILSDYLNDTRGLRTTFENILITRGSTMGLYLLTSVLFTRGDAIILGDPDYYYADRTFANAGMELVRVPLDDYGIDVEAIEKVCRTRTIKAVYVTSHHHYPTTVTLCAARRIRLLQLAEQYGFIIVEDDYDYDYHYLSSPILPLVSSDTKGMVIYIGTLSKTLAPAIRMGYVIAPQNLILELVKLRQLVDSQGDPILELALCDLFEDGTIKRHMKKSLQEYRLRRDFLCDNLARRFPGIIDFKVPDGGLAIWAKFHPSVPLPPLAEKMRSQGIILSNGLIHNTQPISFNATRIGFAWMTIDEAARALDVLEKTIKG